MIFCPKKVRDMATGEDRQESALDLASDCAYIRALDANGKSIRIAKRDLGKVIEVDKKFRMAAINTDAVKLCSINNAAGFYNASIFVRLDAFQLSVFGVIGIYHIGAEYNEFAKLNGVSHSGIANILFVERDSAIDIYMTGNYASGYSSYYSDIVSSCDLVSFDGMGDVVPTSSLNVRKSINIADAVK